MWTFNKQVTSFFRACHFTPVVMTLLWNSATHVLTRQREEMPLLLVDATDGSPRDNGLRQHLPQGSSSEMSETRVGSVRCVHQSLLSFFFFSKAVSRGHGAGLYLHWGPRSK